MTEIEVTRIRHGADDILYTVRHLVHAPRCYGSIRALYESHIFIGLIAALAYIPDEFVWLKGGGIYIGFIPVPDFIDVVIKAIGLSLRYYVISVFSVEWLQGIGKDGFSYPQVGACHGIVHFIGQGFSRLEGGIAYPAKIITGL